MADPQLPHHSREALYFPGNSALIELVRQLLPQVKRADRTTRPLICLVRQGNAPEILPGLHECFPTGTPAKSAGPTIRYSKLEPSTSGPPEETKSPPPTENDVEKVRKLLIELVGHLGTARNCRPIRRFRRFLLITWLMEQELDSGDQANRARKMRDKLRERSRYRERSSQIADQSWAPGWLRRLAILLGAIAYNARISGRIPLLSGHYRWLLRHESLIPRGPGDATDVAIRLTKDEWQRESAREQRAEITLLVLVSAFMEDVRVAYRRRFRTTCCTLLISNISRANGGYHLLRAINEVRNLTWLRDPLLVITESHRVPPFARAPHGENEISKTANAYKNWRKKVNEDQILQKPSAWYLSLEVPPIPDDPAKYRPALRNARIDAPRVPLFRRAVHACLVLLPIVAVISYFSWSTAHCGNGLTWPGFEPTLNQVGDECIGVTDDLTKVFQPLDEQSRHVAQTITNQNALAEAKHRQQPERPYITVISVGMLSAPTSEAGSQATEREELEGAAVAQGWQLRANGHADPLVRVLVANGGRRMTQGRWLADIIASLAREDPSIVGVVGLSASYQSTVDSINALANAGVLSVATLSPDPFADNMLMYYQIPPQNRRQADVVAAFADHLRQSGQIHGNNVRVYYSADKDDIFSNNLREDIEKSFGARGFHTEAKSFTPNDPSGATGQLASAAAAGGDACDFPGIVFWAGRPQPDFRSFLEGIHGCQSLPIIIANNDTTRHVADENIRKQYAAIPFYYVSFAADPRLTSPNGNDFSKREGDFYNAYYHQFNFERDDPQVSQALDGHAALSFDATMTYIKAVEYLRNGHQSVPVSPTTVWRQISTIAGNRSLAGASGYIDFGGNVNQRVPLDKPVMLLKLQDGNVVGNSSAYCGLPPSTDSRTQPWCPFDPPPPR